jgi:nicotinate phosphoribosyltransferase
VISRDQIARYTDHYFTNARLACEKAGNHRHVLYQVFQRGDAVLCGVKYVLELLSSAAPYVEVYGLPDGTRVVPGEAVMHIKGQATALFEYETIYLGLLARMTRVATNVREAAEATRGKPLLFFPARFDIPEAQEYDGYAALIGGAAGASTAAEAEAFGHKAVGTMPHALIAAFAGDTVAATLAYSDSLPDKPVWALVDFQNNSAETAVACFKALRDRRGRQLHGVRLDTSQDLVDESLLQSGSQEHGVSQALVREVRRRLDDAGGQAVKISVSGGFSAEKIRAFEADGAPVDVYAVGERFFRGSTPFTSDIVGYYEGERFVRCAKVGREFRENPKMTRLK